MGYCPITSDAPMVQCHPIGTRFSLHCLVNSFHVDETYLSRFSFCMVKAMLLEPVLDGWKLLSRFLRRREYVFWDVRSHQVHANFNKVMQRVIRPAVLRVPTYSRLSEQL